MVYQAIIIWLTIISSYIAKLIEGISRLLRLILIDCRTDVACCSVPEVLIVIMIVTSYLITYVASPIPAATYGYVAT